MLAKGNKFLTSRWPFANTKMWPLRPLGRQGPIVQQLLGKQILAVQQRLKRWSLIPQLRPASSNNPIWKACSVSRWMLWRREETAFPSYPPVGWHCRPVPQMLLGYYCTLFIFSQGTCLWPLSCPFPIRHLLPGRNQL